MPKAKPEGDCPLVRREKEEGGAGAKTKPESDCQLVRREREERGAGEEKLNPWTIGRRIGGKRAGMCTHLMSGDPGWQ